MEIFEDTNYYGVSFGRVRGYGEIFRCLDQTTGNYVAVKKIVDYHRDIDVPSTKIRAVSFLKELNHDNIIGLLDILNLEDGVYIVLEYCDFDLNTFMHSPNFPKDQLQIKNIQQQILSAVAYCHSNKIVHGDLRSENFLIDLDRSNYTVKLANFESARSLEGLLVDYGCQVATNSYGTHEVSYSSDSAGCDLLSKMLYGQLNQTIFAEDTLEHYYFDSVKKDVKLTEIRGSINGCHQGNESMSRKDPHHKDEYNFDAGRKEDIVYLPDNGSENMVTSSPTVEPSHGTNYADENNAQSQTLKQTLKPIDDPQYVVGNVVDSWPVELSTEPPIDPHRKDEYDFDSRRGAGHDESPVDPNNGSENNLRSNPREQPIDPSFVIHHTGENDVESGAMENLVSTVSNPHNQDGRIESRPTEENEGKSEDIPEILEKKATENLISDPHHKDESELNSRRDHVFAPSNDPDTVTEDNRMRDPTQPSCASHHADRDDVQPGTEEHLVKPLDNFESQDKSDLNSRREHVFAPSNDPDTVTEDNRMHDPTEPSCASHHAENKDYVQPGTEEHLVKPLDNFEIQDKSDLNSRREHLVVPRDHADSVSEDNLRSGSTEQPLEPSGGSHHVDNQMRDPTQPSCASHNADRDDVQPGTEEHLVKKPLDNFEIQDMSDLNSRREHFFAPSNDPDTVTEDNEMHDPTEPSCASHHADNKDYVQPGTYEHFLKPFDNFEIQDKSDLNSRRKYLVVPPDDADSVSEDNLRSGSTEQPLEPSDGSHYVDKDEVQSGTDDSTIRGVPVDDHKLVSRL